MTRSQSGFTLVELAVAMIIIGLLLGGALTTMSAQRNLKMNAETKQLLEEAEEALIGFAIANGRLPCPAKENDPGQQGWESPKNGGPCDASAKFLPASMLGLTPIDEKTRFLIDPWGNPIRYGVAHVEDEGAPSLKDAFTSSAEEIRKVMQKGPGDQPEIDDDGVVVQAVFRIYSQGDPQQSNGDINLWLSPYKFYNRASQAGAL